MPLEYWQRVAARPQKFLGAVPLAAIVLCSDYAPKDDRKNLIEQLVGGRRVLGEAGDCTLYAVE